MSNVIQIADYQNCDPIKAELNEEARAFIRSFPLGFRQEHCAKAREILGWSVEALAFKSSVSVKAIQGFESCERELRRVSLQALAFTFEKEGLVFIPGHCPSPGENVRGCTEDPKLRPDYHLIE